MTAATFSAFIVDAVRTAVGKKNGALRKAHPADLGAAVVNALLERTGCDPALVDDVIFGCANQIGAQASNVARGVVLSSRLPLSVPGTSVDRRCGSGQQAIHFAAQAVLSGTQDVVIAGGTENMSFVPIGSPITVGERAGMGNAKSEEMERRWPGVVFSQQVGAELMCEKYKLSRDELDRLALSSHRKAAEAIAKGHFEREIVPVKGLDSQGRPVLFAVDEGVRADTSLEQLAKLKPLDPKRPDAKITAGTSSQISDGAAALLICNERGLRKLGPRARPMARIVAMALAGTDPVLSTRSPFVV